MPEISKAPSETPQAEDTVDLKDPIIAGLLAWLVPGLGHWYQGRREKAVLYFVCIMGLFVYGLWLGGSSQSCFNRDNTPRNGTIGYGRAVYFSWKPEDKRLPYLCQIGVGAAAMPALVQAYRMDKNQKVLWDGFMAPPRPVGMVYDTPTYANVDQPTAHEINKALARYFELAGVFTMVAGLLNILAIYDACAGPFVARPSDEKEKGKKEEDESKKEKKKEGETA